MALTATDRGGAANSVGGTSFVFAPASNFTGGALAVLCISADNSVTGGATNNITGVTDSLGNVWRARQLSICDNGVANAGVQGGIYTTDQSAGAITTGTTITVTFGASTPVRLWALNEVAAAAGSSAMALTWGTGSAQIASSAPTVTTSSINVGDLVIGMVAIEGDVVTLTADADTTNGSWSAAQFKTTGGSTGGGSIVVQTKLQTTTESTQTFNPTISAARDLVCSWISVREVTGKKLAACGVG